jgi:hypothetical protein
VQVKGGQQGLGTLILKIGHVHLLSDQNFLYEQKNLPSQRSFNAQKKPPNQHKADTDGPIFLTMKYSTSDPILQVSRNNK